MWAMALPTGQKPFCDPIPTHQRLLRLLNLLSLPKDSFAVYNEKFHIDSARTFQEHYWAAFDLDSLDKICYLGSIAFKDREIVDIVHEKIHGTNYHTILQEIDYDYYLLLFEEIKESL